MTDTEIVTLFKCLADKSRLLILKSLAREDMYVERLAERLGLAPGTVSFHLKKLEEAGAVTPRREQYYTVYALRPEAFSFRVLDLLADGADESAQDERDEAYRQKVLASFFVYGKLKKLPTQRKKKNIVLEEIAKFFAPDRAYTEKEVNLLIAEVFDDFCTVRRDMIGCGLLRRQNSIYYKNGEKAI